MSSYIVYIQGIIELFLDRSDFIGQWNVSSPPPRRCGIFYTYE
jgi:hypothetical protein